MDPSKVAILGWLGWIIGLVGGSIEIMRFRRERRQEPLVSKLLERELRDGKGQYSEEQIKDLTQLVKKLNRQVRTEVPALARRTFLENQQREVAKSLTRLYSEYNALAGQIGESTSTELLSIELRQVIEDDIHPGQMRRDRRQRRLYVALAVAVIFIALPYPKDFLTSWANTAPGDSSYILQTAILPYLAGIVIALVLALSTSWSRYRHQLSSKRRRAYSLAFFCFAAWILAIISIALAWIKNGDTQNLLAVLSLIPFGMGSRIFYLLFRWRSARTGVERSGRTEAGPSASIIER